MNEIVTETNLLKFHENHNKIINLLNNILYETKKTNRILLQTNGYDPDE